MLTPPFLAYLVLGFIARPSDPPWGNPRATTPCRSPSIVFCLPGTGARWWRGNATVDGARREGDIRRASEAGHSCYAVTDRGPAALAGLRCGVFRCWGPTTLAAASPPCRPR